jgi:type VI secretion system protein ImpH
LAAVLRSIFGQPTEIEQFVPQRYEMEAEDQNRLGLASSRLGEDLYVGAEITLVQSKFRVRLGPLSREAYHQFLPDRPAFRSLMELVRLAVDESLDFDLQLMLRAEEVAPLRIGEPDAWSARLGWSSWLLNDPFEEPAEDALFDPASGPPTPRSAPESERAAA